MSERNSALGCGTMLIETMIKHLPPSASTLHLLDVDGAAGALFAALRPDIAVTVGLPASNSSSDENRFDAVVAADMSLDDNQLRASLHVLRPGGRLIAVDLAGEPSAALVRRLEDAGYTRILVEEMALSSVSPSGVLLRGEKPHSTSDTLARIQSVALKDAADFKGRYVHLLIRQTPNKPVWALKPSDVVEWQAVALVRDGNPLLLAFSSLPKAVAFMQPAVLTGGVKDVNKVGKFRRAAAQGWRLLINPVLDVLDGQEIVFVPVERGSAETPDE